MATNNTVNFTINLNGNAYNGVVQLSNAVVGQLNPALEVSQSLFGKIGTACMKLDAIFNVVGRTVGRVVGKLSEFEQAGRAQAEAETKLAQVMRNTMGDDIVRRYGNVEAALKRHREAVENLSLSFKELPGKVEIPVGVKPGADSAGDMAGVFDNIRRSAEKANRSVNVGIQLKPEVTGEKEVANAFDRIRHIPVPDDREVRIDLNMRPEITGMKDMAEAFKGIREKAMAANRTVDVGVKLKTTVEGEKEMLKTFDRVRSLTDNAPKGVDMGFDLRPVVHGEKDVTNAMERIRNLGKPMDVKVPVEIQTAVTVDNAFETAMERIRKLSADQQSKGVIGDEIQIAGAQELSTYLTKLSSLEKLIPVMNDMVAQQYGFNASQESAVGIATMMGKVMDGQVGALSRYGYKFDEAQEKILKFGTEEQRVATLVEVVSSAVGGVNEALANTPEGRVVQLGDAYGDLQERLGGLWANLKDSLYPVFDTLIQRADGLIDVIEVKMGAVKEWIAGAVEWLSGVWNSVKEPVMNTVTRLWGSLKTIVGNLVGTITGIVRSHSTVIRGILGIIGWSIRTVGKVLAWLSGVVTGIVNFASGIAPIILGIAAALGVLTLATKVQAIETAILSKATAFGTAIGKIYAGIQLFINAVMAANPVFLIIAAVVALIGVIVFLAIKVKGWGTLWDAVVNFAKYSFLAYVETIKLAWTTMINGLMMGLDKIKEAWYKFRKAVGIGDEAENDAALAKIAQDVKARQQKIAEGSDKVKQYAQAAVDSWKGVHLEWDKNVTTKGVVGKLKAELGITDQSAVTNIVNDQSTGDTELNSELSDASTKISSGGKNIKNINITINDGLVHGVQNYFNSSDDSPDTASDFMWRLANALQLVVNDVNYD